MNHSIERVQFSYYRMHLLQPQIFLDIRRISLDIRALGPRLHGLPKCFKYLETGVTRPPDNL